MQQISAAHFHALIAIVHAREFKVEIINNHSFQPQTQQTVNSERFQTSVNPALLLLLLFSHYQLEPRPQL